MTSWRRIKTYGVTFAVILAVILLWAIANSMVTTAVVDAFSCRGPEKEFTQHKYVCLALGLAVAVPNSLLRCPGAYMLSHLGFGPGMGGLTAAGVLNVLLSTTFWSAAVSLVWTSAKATTRWLS